MLVLQKDNSCKNMNQQSVLCDIYIKLEEKRGLACKAVTTFYGIWCKLLLLELVYLLFCVSDWMHRFWSWSHALVRNKKIICYIWEYIIHMQCRIKTYGGPWASEIYSPSHKLPTNNFLCYQPGIVINCRRTHRPVPTVYWVNPTLHTSYTIQQDSRDGNRKIMCYSRK